MTLLNDSTFFFKVEWKHLEEFCKGRQLLQGGSFLPSICSSMLELFSLEIYPFSLNYFAFVRFKKILYLN